MRILHSVPTIGEDDIESVTKVLRSLHLEEGDYVRNFEKEVAAYFGSTYGQATTNGFSAIHLSLIALGVGPGDEVLMPSYNCPALLNPVRLLGATPVFVDIAPDSFNPDLHTITEKITGKTKAAILPHLFGFPMDLEEIKKSTGLKIIEDCTQSIGGSFKGRKLGTFTEVNITSFYASKMITCGDAGIINTNDQSIYETAKDYVYYGHRKGNMLTSYNYHLTNLPASLGISQLAKLDTFVARRQQIAKIYDSHFSGNSNIFINFQHKADSCYYRYPILVPGRDKLKTALAAQGIFTGFGVLEGIHTLEHSTQNQDLPNTQYYLDHILSLPIYPTLADKEAHYVAEKVIELTA